MPPFPVTLAAQHITFTPLPEISFNSGPIILSASSSSGLPVILNSSNPKVAWIIGNTAYLTGAGLATITASIGYDDNYRNATVVHQVLKVAKASQTISFSAPSSVSYFPGKTFSLLATSASGQMVTFRSSNPNVLSIKGSLATVLKPGIVTITAVAPGTPNYNPSSLVSATITVQ